MAFDRQAAKQAGYSDEEIDAYIAANPHVETKQDKDKEIAAKLPSPEEVMGRTGANPSENVDRTNENLMTGAMGVGLGAAGVGVPVLAYKAGKAILSPAAKGVQQFAQQGMDLGNRVAGAMEGRTAVDAAREARMASGGAYGRPVAPTPMPGVATTGPVAPTNVVAANEAVMSKAAPSMANRVQAAAAQRISNLPAMGEMLGNAGRLASRFMGPAMLAMQTTDLGPAVPRTGRMRGMEINPITGAPWTREQIAQYESNPQMFDAQLAAPQMRR